MQVNAAATKVANNGQVNEYWRLLLAHLAQHGPFTTEWEEHFRGLAKLVGTRPSRLVAVRMVTRKQTIFLILPGEPRDRR